MNTDTVSTSSNDVRGTLLVIDDTPENLTVLRKCLTDHHYRVAVARNGKDAVERVKRIRPDLILLDVLMPGMDGFEVCRRLKGDEETRAIPVIFMTALDTAEDKAKGFEAGAEDYVAKPLNNQEVLARVHTHVTLYKLQDVQRQDDLVLNVQDISLQVSADNLEKIFEEILDNALKFSQAGTQVRVTTMRENDHCILTISAQGCGMTPEQIAGIEAYTQFDRKQYEQQSPGLGLIVAYLLVLWEGGTFAITSEPQSGTTVSIRFRLP